MADEDNKATEINIKATKMLLTGGYEAKITENM